MHFGEDTDMKELINWMIRVESLAARVYEKAASHFSDDKELAEFVMGLSRDEEKHRDYFLKAAEVIESKEGYPSYVSTDNDINEITENFFLLCEERIDANVLTKKNMIEYIVSVEFSKYNAICLNVLATLIKDYREFIPAAVDIQRHMRKIQRFIESDPEVCDFLERSRSLPSVWQEKLLVVDDDKMTRNLLEAVIVAEGEVETATDGEEALEKIREKYFEIIITDLDMPRMNGIELYEKALEMFPAIRDRFLFFSGSLEESHLSFFRENDLRHLEKASPVKKIRKAVADVLST